MGRETILILDGIVSGEISYLYSLEDSSDKSRLVENAAMDCS